MIDRWIYMYMYICINMYQVGRADKIDATKAACRSRPRYSEPRDSPIRESILIPMGPRSTAVGTKMKCCTWRGGYSLDI